MAKLDFNFSGFVRGADITKVTITETGEELNVSDKTAEEIAVNLNKGIWSIALGDFLYENNKEAEIEMTEFAPDPFGHLVAETKQ